VPSLTADADHGGRGAQGRGQEALRLLPSWVVPPLTSPELDAGNCGCRRWERWRAVERPERGKGLPGLRR
jgi:hypothetical protein